MNFSCFPVVFQEVVVHFFQGRHVTKFLGSGALQIAVLIGMNDNLALRIWLVAKEVGQCDPGWNTLLSDVLVFLLLVTLALFLLVC